MLIFNLFIIPILFFVSDYTDNSFSIFDSILFQIWDQREDLQTVYPEVAYNNLDNFKEWAQTSGWKEYPQLWRLIPPGETPDYEQSKNTDRDIAFGLQITILLILSFCFIFFINQIIFCKK